MGPVTAVLDLGRTWIRPLTGTADLHLHSTASDGTLPPAAVVRLAAAAGLAAMALTDHDTVAGVAEARAAGVTLGIKVLTGCEFSVKVEWGEMHLLGYLLPDQDPELLGTLNRMRAGRADRGVAMVEAIRKIGFPIEVVEVERAAAGAPIGRPHVARVLIEKKIVRNFDEAFERFLGQGRPAYVPKVLPELAEITGLIRRVGGVSSAAHLRERGSQAQLAAFKDQGLDAVEVRHPSQSGPVRAKLEAAAGVLGLLKTGGSDCHGEAAVSPSHSVVGGERVPLEWVLAMERLAAERRSPASTE